MIKTYADSTDQGGSGPTAKSQSLSLDDRFEILKNERRRIVLQYLKDAEGTVKLNELANQVTAIENDIKVEAITSEERKRVYVGLYQFHLPKMARMGVVEYDKDRGDITLTEVGDTLYQEYDSEDPSDRNVQRAHFILGLLGISGIIGGLVAQAWLISTIILAIQTAMLVVLWLGQQWF